MLLIVAHHYVVNSGLTEVIKQAPLSADSIFYMLFGAWGKTGINCLVLITGYFLCTSEITLRKFLKLFLWVLTYSIFITAVFSFSGYCPEGLLKMWFHAVPFINITDGFGSCFMVFYLCIPFLNVVVRNIARRQHLSLIFLLLFIYTLHGSIPKFNVSMNYVSWFSVLYFISAYLRLYPVRRDGDTRFWGIMTVFSWGLSILSILALAWIQTVFTDGVSVGRAYFLISDSNAILALTNGITSFMWFKNIKLRNSRLINTIAASSFGVLLIHANSNTMRQWLWKDTVDCVGHYDAAWLYPVVVVMTIYAVCTIIDIIRKHTIESMILNATENVCNKAGQALRKKI